MTFDDSGLQIPVLFACLCLAGWAKRLGQRSLKKELMAESDLFLRVIYF